MVLENNEQISSEDEIDIEGANIENDDNTHDSREEERIGDCPWILLSP